MMLSSASRGIREAVILTLSFRLLALDAMARFISHGPDPEDSIRGSFKRDYVIRGRFTINIHRFCCLAASLYIPPCI